MIFLWSLLLFLGWAWSGIALALPSYGDVQGSYRRSESLLLDRRGEVICEMRRDFERRRLDWVLLREISPALTQALIQAEDQRFYHHSGVDYRAAAAALMRGLATEPFRGASTITMQLAALLDRDLQPRKGKRSLGQKMKQALAARDMERTWAKEEILEAYLNLITYRGEIQGIAAGSKILFGKAPHGLDQVESLILASLVRAPNASAESVIARALHLGRSLHWGVDGLDLRAKVQEVYWGPELPPSPNLAPQLARRLLRDSPFGSKVSSTLDGRIQRYALDCLTRHLIPLRSQNARDGAILVMENKTGEVLAYFSLSGEPSLTRFVDGVQAKRQAGSILKPFLYAQAFDLRLITPASLLNDSPLDLSVATGVYQPQNYDNQFHGLVTVRTALGSSLNIPAVEIIAIVGLEAYLHKLRKLGIQGLKEAGDFYGPSLALGTADVSLWELVNAYRTVANGGEWSEPRLIRDGKKPSLGRRVLAREAAFLISDILSDREARSMTFGLENPLATRFWTAVKTGTSKDMRDNWCVGYSGRYTVGVWVGNFSGEPMWNVSGVSGAAPIWGEMMNSLHRNDPGLKRMTPPNLVRQRIEFPGEVEPPREEWFIRGTEPQALKQNLAQGPQRILYPPNGAILAIDPDIPIPLQKVFFASRISDPACRWVLNGSAMGEGGKSIPWIPRVGKHRLTIVNGEGRTIDSIRFEVRGSSDGGDLAEEMETES
jgi:penicillin-binding protein 1C